MMTRSLSRDFRLFSECYSRSWGVSWLVRCTLEVNCTLVQADMDDRVCVLNATIKGRAFRFLEVYAHNDYNFSGLDRFMTLSSRLVLMGDWKAVLDPEIDRVGDRSSNYIKKDVRIFQTFFDRFDLVDKVRLVNSRRVEWTWAVSGVSGSVQQRSSYTDRVLVKRVDVGLLEGPSFHSTVYSNHRLVRVRLNLDSFKPKMSGYWRFNTSLLEVEDLRNQLMLILKRELTGAIIRNTCWFILNLRLGLSLETIAVDLMQVRSRNDMARGDRDSVAIVRSELA